MDSSSLVSFQLLGYLVKEQEESCHFPILFEIYVALEHEEARKTIEAFNFLPFAFHRESYQVLDKGDIIVITKDNRSSLSGVYISLEFLQMALKLCA